MAATEPQGINPDKPGSLTFKFENKSPVALDDLANSLKAIEQSYEEYLSTVGHILPSEHVKLYVHELRTGSIIATLKALAEQGHIIFGEHGVIDTLQDGFDHADSVAGFVTHINSLVQFFLGGAVPDEEPTKKETENLVKIFEPVAKDTASTLGLQFNGTVNIGTVNITINSQQANAVQNSARRYLGPSIPSNTVRADELMTLHQMKGVTKAGAGDKGIIEAISKSAVKLLYSSDQIKKAILELHENPFRLAFVVDVDVKTIDDKPALYKILALKDSFEKP